MAKNYFKPSKEGQIGLRNSKGVQDALLAEADKVKHIAESYGNGSEYKTDVQPGKNRAHARVSTANAKAYYTQLYKKNLTSALG